MNNKTQPAVFNPRMVLILFLIGLLLFLMTGCVSGVKPIGKIGDTQFFKVQGQSFAGPNFTALYSQQSNSTPQQVAVYGGDAIGTRILGSVVQSAGAVGAGAAIRPATTKVSNGGLNEFSPYLDNRALNQNLNQNYP